MNGTTGDLALEAEGGAVPLASPFYISRPCDAEFNQALVRGDGIVLVKGPRQVGKTSLLARGLQAARQAQAQVILLDFQTLGTADFQSANAFCQAMARIIAEQADLEVYPEDDWDPARSATGNLTRFLTTVVLRNIQQSLVLGLDEVDRLFVTDYSNEVFGMFRGWHNRRALAPDESWNRLTLAISFATEAHLFITDLNQSPFNVGTRVTLRDLLPGEVADLNERYGTPLASNREVARLYRLLGGHPYLIRKALHDLTLKMVNLDFLEQYGHHSDGPFSDHLRRILILLALDPEVSQDLHAFIHRGATLPERSFFRLRGAGVLAGSNSTSAIPRCELFRQYLLENLL